jgi:hypothetical protein
MSGHGNHAPEEVTQAIAAALRHAGFLVGEVDTEESSLIVKTEKDGPRIGVSLENVDAMPGGRSFIENTGLRIWVNASQATWTINGSSGASGGDGNDPPPSLNEREG